MQNSGRPQKLLTLSGAALLALGLGWYYAAADGPGVKAPAQLGAAAASDGPCAPTLGDFGQQWLLTGEVAAREAALVTIPSADIWPITVRWIVDDGQPVQVGDRLAELDGTQLQSQIESLETQVKTATNSLNAELSRASAEIATLQLDRASKLAARDRAAVAARLPEELVPAREVAEKKLALERAEIELSNADAKLAGTREALRASIELQELALRRAENELAEIRATLERMVISAPVTGVFLAGENPREQRLVQAGDALWTGFRLGRIPSAASWQVEARLPDVDDGKIRPLAPVRAWLDAEPDNVLHGRVVRIDSIAQEISRNSARRAFQVLVEIDEFAEGHPSALAERLRPGMSVRVEVFEPSRQVRLLPRRCLAQWPAEQILACNAQDCEVSGGTPGGTPSEVSR